MPDRADKRIFILAPFLSLVPAFLVFSVVPIGGVFNAEKQGAVEIFGHHTFLQVADPPIGVLLILAFSSIAIYGIMLAGWSSGSKYPLLGSVRASAQMVRSEEHTSELQSLMRISYAVFCLKKKTKHDKYTNETKLFYNITR